MYRTQMPILREAVEGGSPRRKFGQPAIKVNVARNIKIIGLAKSMAMPRPDTEDSRARISPDLKIKID